MCGIAGYVDFAAGAVSAEILGAMARALGRRGPDSSGIVQEGPCGLAHTRLSIIDLAGSPQPMRLGGSSISLVYNGELYNYRRLREDLQGAGVSLETNGDTEAILRWVGREWSGSLDRFDGMFAFGAWDRDGRRLLLARDPFGVKPLYYAVPREGLLVFGSEIKALLAHPEVEREVDPDALRQVLRFRAVYGEKTLYRGIRQVEPGSWLELTERGTRGGRYFDLLERIPPWQERLAALDEEEIVAQGFALMEGSVRKRMIADVPVGAFLSGGLDSSLIVALMRRARSAGEELCTFSVGFQGDEKSELGYAAEVARAVGTRHTEVHLAEEDYGKLLPEMTWCRDAPISEPADLAIARMSQVARQTVKVVLSGEGSDEVFCGYPKYGFARAARLLQPLLAGVGPERVARLAGMVGLDPRRARVAARSMALPGELDRLVQWFSYLDREELTRLFPGLGWSDEDWERTVEGQRAVLERVPAGDPVRRMQLVDCLSWLPGNLLERGDRMTMAYGLEAREPFLDKELVSFGFALPDRMKVRHRGLQRFLLKGPVLKWIVRRWARDLIPPVVVKRPKWGFRVPLAAWFRGRMLPLLERYLLEPRGLCGTYGDPAQARRLIEEHRRGVIDANLMLWTLLAAEVWYQDVHRAQLRPASRPGPVPAA